MIPYGKQWIDQRDISTVTSVLRSDFLTQGPFVERFEQAIAKKVQARHAVACSSGTAALHLACLAAGIGVGDEVIVPTLSFVASANSVLYCGGTPVLCDIAPDTLTIDLNDVAKRMTRKIKAIIAVDFAGHPAQWNELRAFAKKEKLILIDDAAHALGAKYKGIPVGSLADLTTFSFHPVKSITTGEGGMIVTDNKQYAEKMKLLRSHGIVKGTTNKKQEMIELGFNYRLTDIQTALGLSQLKKLEQFLQRRRKIALQYIKAFSPIDEIVSPPNHDWINHAWHIFPIQLKSKSRDEIYKKLLKKGIKCQVHYWPIHLQPYYQEKFGYKKGDFPKAENYASRCLTIPLFPAMSDKIVEEVIQAIYETVGRGK